MRERRHTRDGAPSVSGITGLILLTTASLLASTALHVAAAAVEASQPRPSPLQMGRVEDLAAGSLLVAARDLADPNFARTVVVLLDHDDGGTLGLVINRQTDVPLSRVFAKLSDAQSQSEPVYLGGPVSMTAVQALVRSPKTVAQGQLVADDLHVIRTRRALEARLRAGADPAQFRVYLGYAGWATGQLAQEVNLGAWHIFPADVEVVFDAEPDTVWDRLIRRTEVLLARNGRRASVRLPAARLQVLERSRPVLAEQP